jgi:hypothetical protein
MRSRIKKLLVETLSDEENENIKNAFSKEHFAKQQRGIPTKGKMEKKQSTPVGDLVLEINPNVFGHESKDFMVGNTVVMTAPNVNEDYWLFRVRLYKDQAILGFPKFGLIGIGFAQERDWNTNLPSSADTMKIFNWIKRNKKYRSIPDEKVIEAIKIVQEAAKQYKNKSLN